MRGDPIITITCDGGDCGGEEFEARLTPLAGNCFDERGVDDQLKRFGWTKDGDRGLCAECSESDE